MLKTLRPLPLRHEWVFWHDKYVAPGAEAAPANDEKYENQLKELAQISTVQVIARFSPLGPACQIAPIIPRDTILYIYASDLFLLT